VTCGSDEEEVLTDSSSNGFPPSKIPRTQRGDTSRSLISPPRARGAGGIGIATSHQTHLHPPVMRGRKKSVERGDSHLASPSPSSSPSRYHPSLHNTSTLSSALTRPSQRSLSPQPSRGGGGGARGAPSSPIPSHKDSLSTHSFIPSTSSASSSRRASSSRSPPPRGPAAASPPPPSSGRGAAHTSPSRTTSRTIPRTPTSVSKTTGRSRLPPRDKTPPRHAASPPPHRPLLQERGDEEKGEEKRKNNFPPPLPAPAPHSSSATFSAEQAERYILSLVVVCGGAKALLSQYHCEECIALCQQLPRRHFSSGWVQQLIGRAHFELNDYKVSLCLNRSESLSVSISSTVFSVGIP
jgi:hypothetical protein